MGAGNPQAPTCAACPRSEWTKINANGNKVPWCTQKYKVALLIPGFDTVFLLAVPPASHGPLRRYLATCKGNGVNPNDLVTRMWFVSQGVLGFAPGGRVARRWPISTRRSPSCARLAYAEKTRPTRWLVGTGHGAASGSDRPATCSADCRPAAKRHAAVASSGRNAVHACCAAIYPAVAVPGAAGSPAGGTRPVVVTAGHTTSRGSQPAPFGVWPAARPPTGQATPSSQAAPASGAATTSPTEQPAGTRRKRRTQAEIAAANEGRSARRHSVGAVPTSGSSCVTGP